MNIFDTRSVIFQDATPGGDYSLSIIRYDKIQPFRQFCRDLAVKQMEGDTYLNTFHKQCQRYSEIKNRTRIYNMEIHNLPPHKRTITQILRLYFEDYSGNDWRRMPGGLRIYFKEYCFLCNDGNNQDLIISGCGINQQYYYHIESSGS